MNFYLTALSLSRFLTEDAQTYRENDQGFFVALEAWSCSYYLCRHYVINSLYDSLYDVYSKMKSTMELWDSLEQKYESEHVRRNNFLISHFFLI